MNKNKNDFMWLVMWLTSCATEVVQPLSYILQQIIGFITIHNSMTSTDNYFFTGISARLILNAGNRALTRTSIFFNTHNSTNPYFLTCNLILTAATDPTGVEQQHKYLLSENSAAAPVWVKRVCYKTNCLGVSV